MKVTNIEELMKKLKEVKDAQKEFSTYTQEEVDKVFREVAMEVSNYRITLAKMAVEETGMGIIEDKVIKNHFASEYIYNKYKDEKTCGVIERDEAFGMTKIAEPIGVVAAVIPTTNPTSTAIFKALISLKTRNGIILSPHPRAKNCTIAAAKIVLDAAVRAGAPKGIIGWIDEPTVELSQILMREADITLATGGPAMVKAAYSSGKPAIGVGPGNTPVIIDETAHIKMAHASTIAGMAFANAFLGVCHSMAHKLGAEHHIPHGVANALLINEVIRFNAVDNPLKQTAYPQYKYPNVKTRYARIADYLNLGGKTEDEKLELLIKAIDELKEKLDLPKNIKEAGVTEKKFYRTLDEMSEQAFDDQCTGANPRYPLIKEIKQMFINAYDAAE
ncbi:iron-containing alcohol dehydrogenase [Clostridium sp. YIM B02555]|uniref:aldehyde dehydrogenase family protein n=1 Tax=Clostridium sp. YIM B02555 TaxID=2911968 RepID=UPI001EEDB73C|nr:iron-containing alcohol dehydrogenase [Clostridium sp. YIM B02555]